MNKDLIFDNTEIAFSLKSDSELERAYFLFKMISIEPLVRIGTAATNFALKANLPIEGLIRSTVFDHFCGGVTEEDCLSVIENMYQKGVSSVLDYSVEGKESEETTEWNRVIDRFDAVCKKAKTAGNYLLGYKLVRGAANKGYNVAKYVPFGPVKDVMPYLIRRAEENTSVAGQTGRELALLKKEKNRRK